MGIRDVVEDAATGDVFLVMEFVGASLRRLQRAAARPRLPEAGARAAHGVKCDVDVVSWRERRVLASVAVAADVDTLWQVITDYERLADFIPNLVQRSAFSRASRLSLSPVHCDSDCPIMVMARLVVSDWRIFFG